MPWFVFSGLDVDGGFTSELRVLVPGFPLLFVEGFELSPTRFLG